MANGVKSTSRPAHFTMPAATMTFCPSSGWPFQASSITRLVKRFSSSLATTVMARTTPSTHQRATAKSARAPGWPGGAAGHGGPRA